MLIQLTHPEPNYEFWIESEEIVVMERYTKPESSLITLNDKPTVTALVMKNGRIMSCIETPKQVLSVIEQFKADNTQKVTYYLNNKNA